MKKLLLSIVVILLSLSANAQEHKVSMSSGKVHIKGVNEIDIVGYNGSEIIISKLGEDGEECKDEDDDRAKGLREINAVGATDNTGVGLSATKSGNELLLEQISNNNDSRFTIKVPKGVSIFYEHSTHNGDLIRLKNIESEIEIDANYNDIEFENLTGPIALNTVYGDIDGTFNKVSSTNDVAIYSVYGYVDVTVPGSTKADFRLSSSYGQMFTDLNLDVVGSQRKDSKKITGSLNGGGIDFSIKASYDNIYLRKKKS